MTIETGVLVEDVQRMYFDTGLSYTEAAARLGWMRKMKTVRRHTNGAGHTTVYRRTEVKGDGSRLKRRLGLLPEWKNGEPTWNRHCRPDTAAAMARAWGMDPVDYGF